MLRNSLLVSLLAVRKLNQDRRTGEVRLFESGKVFLPAAGRARPDERTMLGVLDERGFLVLADAVRRLPSALELDGACLEWAPCGQGEAAFLAPGQVCRVFLVGGKERRPVGWLGVAAADLVRAFDLKRSAAVAELDLAALSEAPASPRRFRALSTQPEVVRDVALVVDEDVMWGEVASFAASHADPLRDPDEAPRYLSAFRGKQIGAGKKSLAFSVVYRLPDRSLTDDEVNAAHQRFVDALLKRFKATLRG